MNKQEALVAALEKMRGWEEAGEEVQRQPDEYVYTMMVETVEWLAARHKYRTVVVPDKAAQEALARVAAAALYLLVDEIDVVAGRTLEQWLAETARTDPANSDVIVMSPGTVGAGPLSGLAGGSTYRRGVGPGAGWREESHG